MKLMGWDATRRVVVLRRPLQGEGLIAQEDSGQQLLGFIQADRKEGKRITGYADHWFVPTALSASSFTLGTPDASFFDFPVMAPSDAVSKTFLASARPKTPI